MESVKPYTMSLAEAEQARQDRLNEVGTEPPCPFCGRPRVSRSSYIRCNPCGVNWLNEEMNLPNYLEMDPRVSRAAAARMGKCQPPIAEPLAEPAK